MILATGQSSVFIEQPTPSPDSLRFVSFLGLVLGPEGDLFVSDFANDIRRYSLETGNLVDVLSTNYTGTVPSNNFIGNLTKGTDNILYTVGFDSKNNDFGAILRYDGVTGNPLPAPGNDDAIFVPTDSKLLRPIGIVFTSQVLSTSVPEPTATMSLLALGALGMVALSKRQRHL